MKNLGKILFLLFILTQSIYAGITASVDSSDVQYGDVVTYSLTLSGEDVKKPEIFTLCGEDVAATGSSTSIQIVNGDYQKSYVLSYKFVAKKSCVIEPIELDINGVLQKTEAIEVTVSKHVSSKNDDFLLELFLDKEEVYVGEAFELTLLFTQKKSAQVLDNKFVAPDLKGFWVKEEPKQELQKDKEFIRTKIIYKLAAQRDGVLPITPAQISIASRQNTKNYWGGVFPEVKWKNYFSNDLNITAKKVPNDVSLVGDFTITAVVDTMEVNPNEVVNLTIKVQGEGNLEDIKSFKPYIQDVSIFDEKILIEDNLLSQKITFVTETDFTIPSFSLKVFNPKTKETQIISTKEIEIKVNNVKAKKEELHIQREEKTALPITQEVVVEKKLDTISMLAILILGIILGVLIMLLKSFISFKTTKKLDIKNHKMLLVKLLPYKDNEDVKVIVDILENNLYKQEKVELNKKTLKEIIKKYEIS